MILIWSNIRILVIILSGAAHINVCWMQSSIWAVGQNHNFLEFFPPLILMIALSKHQYERWVDLTAQPLNCSYQWYPLLLCTKYLFIYFSDFLIFIFQVFALFNDVAYVVGTYFLYLDWKSNPAGTNAPQPTV